MSFSGDWGILMLKFQMSIRYVKYLSLSISHEKWRLRQKSTTIFLSEGIFWVKIDKFAKTRVVWKIESVCPNGTAKKLWHFNCIWQHAGCFFPYKITRLSHHFLTFIRFCSKNTKNNGSFPTFFGFLGTKYGLLINAVKKKTFRIESFLSLKQKFLVFFLCLFIFFFPTVSPH